MNQLKRSLSKLLSFALAFLMLFEASGNAFAYMVEDARTASESEDKITLTDSDGNVTEPDESWETTFPYGAFAFERSGLAVKEGESGVIKVYRLGGTAGRATAYIKYQPSLTKDENGEAIYDFAISAGDVVVSVEEPQPAAKYQPVGKEPDPQETDAAVTAEEGEDGWTLSVDVENADSYAWQVSENGGVWNDLDGADTAVLPADAEALDESYDYRCVYTADGVRYCTDSLRGTEYVRAAEEELAPMPEDIDLAAEPVYTPLELTAEGEDPYSAWLFELVFADGEWVKELHIDALSDELAEAAEAATFTIVGCDGGAVLDASSTLLLRIEDTNEPEPSTLGFTAELVEADKAEGFATVMIRRVGGKSRPVTVKYATADDTAVAGTDYAYAEGTLLFYGGIDELPVRVELIDDGEVSEDPVRFYIELSELQGDDGCTLELSRAAVDLTNSGTGEEENNATRLYDPDAVDLSGSVGESATVASSADSGETVVSGEAQEIEAYEPVYSELRFEDPDSMTTQVYAGNVATILFKNPASNAWGNNIDLASNKSWWSVGNTRETSLLGQGETTGKLGSGGKYTVPFGIALASKDSTDATFNAWTNAAIGAGANGAYVGQMFSQFQSSVRADTAHDTAYLHGGHYDYSYTKPNLQVVQGGILLKTPQNSARSGKGPLDKNWKIRSTDDWSNYYNPFTSFHTGSFALNTTNVTVKIEMHYAFDNGHTEHENDDLNDYTMLAVNNLILTRRTFAQDAFQVEFSTPNDENTAPNGGAVLSDYASFVPLVELKTGGVQGQNALYVGSTVRLTAGTAPAGYYLSDVVVYQSTDGGASWTKFDKFIKNVDQSKKEATLQLVGGSSSLTADDLTAQYKFRVVYARTSTVQIDLSPSRPRDSSGAVINDVDAILNGYGEASDHGFIDGVSANITYGYSTFSTEDWSTTLSEKTLAKSKLSTSGTDGTVLSFSDVNVQWVNFGLSNKDLLLVNGRAYPGDATIYLRESDLSGKMTVYYYHENYQNSLNAMKTSISWIGVYWDANGNGRIDGYFNDAGNFVLEENGDEFYGYIDAGEYNETMFAPKKNAAGVYCQYFLKVCYTMIPRCLSVPEDADAKTDRAQVMPAFITALNADSPAYSKSTVEQRQYRYLISGKTSYDGSSYDYSADNHPMYLAEAAKKSTVDIPLGGDTHPAEIQNPGEGQKSYYTWTPAFEGALLYEYAAPTPITIENSVAGVTEVTDGYKFENGELSYEPNALDKMNAYLGSFTGSTTFALVTQEQNRTVGEGENETKINTTTDTILDKVTPGAYGDYYVKPDSVTLGGVSTTPDASYLKEVNNPRDPDAAGGIDMDKSGSEMGEFNVDLGIDLGGTEISLTDAVTIILDGNQVGFAIGVPLGEVDKDEGKTGFGDANKESWTQFKDFFDSSNFGGDDDYRKASDSYKSAKSGGYKPDKSDFRSKSMGAEFSMSIAFMFEYNPLDNGFYFEGMTISCSAEFSIRVQGRLTVCPIVYFYMEFTAGIEATTGLGVIREAVEENDDNKPLNAKGSDQESERVKLTYIQSPGAGNAIITAEAYGELGLSERSDYRKVEGLAEGAGAYFWNSKRFASYEAAKENFLDSRDYLLTRAQYDQLSADEQAEYKEGAYYYKGENLQDAQTAFHDLTTYEFETPWKAFNICFSGKLSVEVYTKNSEGTWVPAAEDSGFITGFLTSDGQDDTQVVLKKQDDMKLGEPVKVVLRAMNYDDAVYGEQTTISYIARIENIRNEVYWKGIEITPSLGLEVGAGIGMELLKLELYAKVGLEATFLLGVYNENYDPDDPENNSKYKPASVESFEFAIGLGVRVVLLVFTFELDVATYVVEYDGGKWETGWHFLNDWVGQSSEPGYLGVTITPPSRSSAQKLYTPEDNAPAEMSTQAINPTDTTVPFQLSGQNSTGVNAFALGTGLLSGTDYKLVRAGGRSFIVYTLSRDSGADEDLPMLVMSEVAYNAGTKTYGLVNPADSESETRYIVLDAADDKTGDLDFDVWTEESGTKSTVHAAWVSYASTTKVKTKEDEPEVDAYEGMTADNFDKIAAPTEPTVDAYPGMTAGNYNTIDAPTKPDEVTEPVESDYYTPEGEPIDKAEYDALENTDGYVEIADGKYQKYTPVEGYATYADAKAAYEEAKAAYDEAIADKANYDKASESYTKWKEYYTKLDSYTKWKTYYTSLSSYNAWAQQRLADAAKNTVVKTASWSFTTTTQTQSVTSENADGEETTDEKTDTVYDNDPAFSTPVIRVAKDETNPTHLFAPTVIGSDALFYASVAKTDEGDKEYDLYKQYLDDTEAGSNYRDFLLQTKKSTLDVYGVLSALNVTFQTDDGAWVTSTHELSGKYTVGNIEVKQLSDGAYYVVYTVSADAYEKNSDGKYADRYTEERLCINRVTVDRDNGTAAWSGNYVLRVIRSYDENTTKDGLYNTGEKLLTAFESPYFSNLSFLNGKIDKEKLTGTGESFTTFSNDTAHDFLLFEMNGTTYVILDDDLKTITTTGSGTIYPFFTGATVKSKDKEGNETEVQQVSGKLEVSIGADENGNLYAVYTSAVSGTTNNAIYLASYDPKIGAWSDGVILAMNGMSVYEQSSKNGWSEDLTQAAYWGVSGGKNGGILTSESAKGLFGESGTNIYNTLASLGTTLGNGRSVTLSGLQTSFGASREDLLILTRGVTTPLQALATKSTNSAGKPETKWNVTPTYTDGRMDTTSGIYAIRYGHSEKALGEGSISFVQANFSAGSTLQIEASAVNIGDTAFYYDDDKGPITVKLMAGGQELLKSEITENIKPGQTVAISGTAAALEKDLEDGTKFTLTVSEKDGTSKDITLFTVSLKPDLGVEQLTLTNPTVSDDGSSTRYEFSFIAANRGSADAEDVFAQISYADADGAYHALDLTASDLKIDPEKSLSEFQTQAASSASELQLGILNLYNAEDGDADIAKGNGRLVHGTLSVPAAAYASGEAKALELRVELFSKGDQANVTTLVTQSVHDEYYTANNAATVLVGAKTQFTAASRIVIPLGTTTLIPLSAVSSRGTKPSITVEETHDANDADGQNIGILNFKQSRASGGTVSGVISITPSSLGTGIINVYDTATNSLVAIAFEVTNSDDGIDIYNDNQSFEFYDEGATEPIDPSSVPANSDWSFTSADKWGVKGENEEAPLRNNLSYGKPGAFFRFSTVAESIDLYFRGTITVSSTDPNVPDATYTNVGGSTPVKNIKIAEIKDGKLDARTITVTVSGAETASFDRLVEHYPGNVVPLPSFDREAPNLYWSRSFPDTASIKTGEPGIPLKLYALDDGGVSYIEVNGTRYTANDDEVAQLDPDGRLLCYTFPDITANGTYNVAVADTSGNITRETLVVDWFNDIAHDNNGTVNVPVYDVGFYVGDAPVTGLVRASDLTSLNLKAALGEGQTAAEKLELRYFGTELTDLKPETDGSYKIDNNGIYWFRALNSSNGTYYSVFLCMDKIDKEIPTVDLTYDAVSGKLSWSAAKAGLSAAVIETVTINDEPVNTTTGLKLSGTKATAYNGDYVIAAVDAVGNRVEKTLTVADAPISIAGSTVTVYGAWNADKNNGKVDLDLTGVIGGTWDKKLSDTENGTYRAQYQAALLPGGYDLTKLDEVSAWITLTEGGTMAHAFEGLELGSYLLVVRDAAEPGRYTTQDIEITWEAIEADVSAALASYATAEDGVVGVTRTNGRAAYYEFAILPAPASWDGKDLSLDTFLASATAEAPLTWLPADNISVSAFVRTFDGLAAGNYLVAVRGLYGATDAEITELKRLGRDLTDAQNALKLATAPDAEQREKLEKAVEDAQKAYSDAAAALTEKNNNDFYGETYDNEYWQRTRILPVTVGFYSESSVKTAGTNENGSTIIELKPGKKLTSTDSSKIYKENRENSVLLRRGSENVYLPAGTLTPGFDVNRILIDSAAAADGMVVEYTDLDGNKTIVPWCLVSADRVSYFVLGPGDYELVPASCEFTDIAGLWGEDAIRFAAHRGLLSGVGNDLFAPQGTMTRAMFVTVLWRIAGCPAAEAESEFTDLSADWYRASVAWGAETGVVKGLSDTEFGPNYPVTREQMCVLLCRFAEQLGLNIGSAGSVAFSDAGDISVWAMDAIGVCAGNGLILGVGDNRFAPKDTAKRMEVSALFTRFITQMVEKYAPAAE